MIRTKGLRRRHRAIGKPTAAQQAQQDRLRAHGCAACRLMGLRRHCGPTELHHRNTGDLHGQKQLGQDAVVALGSWHHRGVSLPGMTPAQMRQQFGPSLALHKRAFVEWIEERLGERSTEALQRWQEAQAG